MSGKIHYALSNHARTVIAERDIPEAWVERVLADPERTGPDASDPALRHALGRIPGQGDRVLRVVYNETVRPWRVVTAYFDRGMRGKL
jgi:hypothetical protein